MATRKQSHPDESGKEKRYELAGKASVTFGKQQKVARGQRISEELFLSLPAGTQCFFKPVEGQDAD